MGHPLGVYAPELVRVPRLEFAKGPRRGIVAESSGRSGEDVDVVVVRDRLQNLGYAT